MSQSDDKSCPFCSIIKGESPVSMVYETDTTLAFMDINPINEGHVLIVPKAHFETLDDCDRETAKELMCAMQVVNKMVASAVRCEGVLNEIMNGEAAGQEVFHLHLHVIPRYQGDGFGWRYADGYGENSCPRSVLDSVAERIKGGD